MSQYNPTPYPPRYQPASGYAQADPYAARGAWGSSKLCIAAAIAHIVAGALVCLLAFCLFGMGSLIASGTLPQEQQAEVAEVTAQFGDAAGILFIVTGICVGLPGLGQMILGFFVWRGSKVGLIISMIVDGLFGGLVLLNLATVLAKGGVGDPAGIFLHVLMLGIVGGLIVLLAKAYREASAIKAAKAAYEAQWQQYYQQQYQYQLALQQQAAMAQQPPPQSPAMPPAPPQTPPADQPRGTEPPLPPPAGA